MSKSQNGEYREVSGGKGPLWSDRKHHLWFPLSFTKYSIENGRMYINSGFLSSREDECLLYRIMDITMTRSLAQRLFGTGTIHLNTKDRSTPVIHLENVKRPVQIKRMLSTMIEDERRKNNVTGKEMYGAISHMDHAEHDEDIDDMDNMEDDFDGHF